MNLTDKQFWDKYFSTKPLPNIDDNPFADFFPKYLEKNHGAKSALEVGCAGGGFLGHIAKHYGYKAFGSDFSDEITQTAYLFKKNGLEAPTLFKEDFFNWRPKEKFDLVCSFGFVEHFENLDAVIKAHADLVSPRGLLFVTMPHFAHLQYPMHWLLDRENLEKHNTKIMNLRSLRSAMKNLPFEIQHLDYYQTIGFWTEDKNLNWWQRILYWTILRFSGVISRLFGDDFPNPLFSPFIVLVARKT